MESYITIAKGGCFEYEDRKSRFIGMAKPVENEEDALDFIRRVKKKYPDARHHVYAYVLRHNSTARFSDDREPQGTAGMPVLDSIRKAGITDAVVVVTRYFGGILLGTGGLVRAYTEAAAGALREGGIVTYDVYCSLAVTLSYSDYQRFLPLAETHGFRAESTDYRDDVKIEGSIIKRDFEKFDRALREDTASRAKVDLLGEKFSY